MLTSVPEFVKRTISTEGTASITIFARMFSFTDGAPKDVPFSRVACHGEGGQANADAYNAGDRGVMPRQQSTSHVAFPSGPNRNKTIF